MMSRLSRPLPFALLALAAACAPARQSGSLSPLGARVTNEVLGEDTHVLDAWAHRVDALRQPLSPAPGAREYAIARAAAWLAYARDAYAWDPRDGTADAALGETRRIVVALEAGVSPDLGALPVATAMRARPDLWAEVDRARRSGMTDGAPLAIAGAEVALVRAARVADQPSAAGIRRMTDAERACEVQVQVATAERLVSSLRAVPEPIMVALQGQPVAAAVPTPLPQPVPPAPTVTYAVQRVVHFALNSSELALPSRVTLGEVIAMLRSHPGVNLVIEGFTDMRGDSLRNRALATRRAEAVRRHLESANLALGRITIAGVGADSTAARSASATAYARDRRVTLSFTDADGRPLTLTSYQALGDDHERDLQVEQRQQHRGRAARAPRATAGPRSLSRVTP